MPGNVLSFVAYWISDAFNAATWQFAAGIVAVGLTWRESLGAVALGSFIISIVISLNGATRVIPFSFALTALGVNISANSLSAANDLAALFPSYINIRRGQLLCAVLC
ncbi:uncharacterized protein BDZ99DRAFT_137255 [Mytilinidion resinicola]|uniref:Uncharacterized protein n=1 Tax=Mytilinidion resinicola TaxID=574789 RepID=A0A6A6Z629_9PEZI|nr:uncharacterized protein BDZ99DRAFT_137255 [Mytilinidion resinicola]KAF2816490.1 hypothetical protein BDZ99DRAFT_137255 [Mytilinidion resinicola]